MNIRYHSQRLTCSQLIDTRHCEQDLWQLKYERLLIAHNGPSVQPLRPLHAMNVRSQSEY